MVLRSQEVGRAARGPSVRVPGMGAGSPGYTPDGTTQDQTSSVPEPAMRITLLVPLIVTAGLLGAVALNEVTQGGLTEAFGAGHHHVLPDDHEGCHDADPQRPRGSPEEHADDVCEEAPEEATP